MRTLDGLEFILGLIASFPLAACVGWLSVRAHARRGTEVLDTFRLVLVHLIVMGTPLFAIVEVLRYAAQEFHMAKFETPVSLWEVLFDPLWIVEVIGTVLWLTNRELRRRRGRPKA